MMTLASTGLTESLLTPKLHLRVKADSELLLKDVLAVRATTDLGTHAGVAPPHPHEAAAGRYQ
jgi:hypothetical protein